MTPAIDQPKESQEAGLREEDAVLAAILGETGEDEKAKTRRAMLERLDADISRRFRAAREARRDIEREMLEDMWRREGKYDPETAARLKAAGGSRTFDNVTEAKCAGAQAMLAQMLLFSDAPLFGIKHTPIPDLERSAEAQAIARAVAESEAAGRDPVEDEGIEGRIGELSEAIEREIEAEADARDERMKKLLSDMLAEGDFRESLKAVLYDFATFGVAGWMGPLPRMREMPVASAAGLTVESKLMLEVERVSPFDLYPAPLSAKPEDGDFFVRRLISDDDARKLREMPSLLEGRLDLGLQRRGASVDDQSLDRVLAEERNKAPDIGETYVPDGMHELIFWWHRMTRSELEGLGREASRPGDGLVSMMGLMLNGVVVSAEENWDPTGKPQVHVCSFRAKPGTMFGTGVSGLCKDKQTATNVMTRACLQNAVMSSQTSFVAVSERFERPEDLFRQFPGKVYFAKPSIPGDNTRPVEQLPTQNYTLGFLSARERIASFLDDATGVYPQAYGSPRQRGPAETASGYEMLREDQAVTIKLAVANLDSAIRSLVESLWRWVMVSPGHDDCKGDMQIVPSGAMQLFLSSEDAEVTMSILELFSNNQDVKAEIKPDAINKLARKLVQQRRENPDEYVMSAEDKAAAEAAEAQAAAAGGGEGGGPGGEMPVTEPESARIRAQADMMRAEAAQRKAAVEEKRLTMQQAAMVQRIRDAQRKAARERLEDAARTARTANAEAAAAAMEPMAGGAA